MIHSTRAAIFAKVLKYINNNDWEDHGDFLIFGKEAFDHYTEDPLDYGFGHEDALRDYVSEVKSRKGNISVKKRISTARLPDESDREDLLALLRKSFPSAPEANILRVADDILATTPAEHRAGKSLSQADDVDNRDASLALEAIEWLNRATARLDTFDETGVRRDLIRYAEYFEEAHRCNLAEFKISTALLCRAVIEGALTQVIDPNRQIRRTLKADESYIKETLEAAGRRGILDENRVKDGIKVRDAGNDATHDPLKFRSGYSKRMDEILDYTRKIIEDLYR